MSILIKKKSLSFAIYTGVSVVRQKCSRMRVVFHNIDQGMINW